MQAYVLTNSLALAVRCCCFVCLGLFCTTLLMTMLVLGDGRPAVPFTAVSKCLTTLKAAQLISLLEC